MSALDLQAAAAIAHRIRLRVLEYTLDVGSGYMSQACSSAEILAALYGGVVKLGAVDSPYQPPPFTAVPAPGRPSISGAAVYGPRGPDADRLIISPAHYALPVYAALIEVGRLAEDALDQFNKDGSTVEMIGAEHSPGFETTTGSLSHTVEWPGKGKETILQLLPVRDAASTMRFDGSSWTLIDLLRAASSASVNGDTLTATFTLGGRWVTYDFTINAVANPFTMRELRQFECPAPAGG